MTEVLFSRRTECAGAFFFVFVKSNFASLRPINGQTQSPRFCERAKALLHLCSVTKSEVFAKPRLSQPVTSFAKVRSDFVGILDSFSETYLAALHMFHWRDPRLPLALAEEYINNLVL